MAIAADPTEPTGIKAQPGTDVTTEYIVLRQNGGGLVPVGGLEKPAVFSGAREKVIKAAARALPQGERKGVYYPIPRRSWKPGRYGTETIERDFVEDV